MRRVKVWDAPTRLFHWALVLLIAFLWWTGETDQIDWHKLAGFAVAALLAFRFYWGFLGASTARFAGFLRGPRAIWRYLRGGTTTIGHNPLGGWSVVALLALLAAETGLGLFAIDEDGLESGPFASAVGFDQARLAAHLHSLVFDALLAFIALHVAAVLSYLIRGQNLIGPMLTGRKRLTEEVEAPVFAPSWSFAIGAVVACTAFGGLWWIDNH